MAKSEQDILEMVRRLFELSKSSNIHESEAAMMKAQELLHKYNLNVGAVPTDEKQPYVREFITPKNPNPWARDLMNTITRYNGVKTIGATHEGIKCWALIGQRHAIEISVYGYQQMERKIEWLAQTAWEIEDELDLKERDFKAAYATGAVTALAYKLKANEERYTVQDSEQSKALVVVQAKELQDAVRGFYPNLTTMRAANVNALAYNKGSRAGRYLDVNAGITGGKQGTRMIS